MLVEIVLKLLGYKRERVFKFANILGYIRYHIGYVGSEKSKTEFLKEIKRVFPEKNDKEIQKILKDFWKMHQQSFLDFFMAYRLDNSNYQDFFEFHGIENLEDALSNKKSLYFQFKGSIIFK